MTDQNEFRLSAWGIRNPIPVTVLFIALVVMGLFAYFKLPVKNFPNVEFPAVAVIVTRNGAAPAEMESQITRQVENSMAGLANVQNIASTITQGSSTTVVQFYLGTDLQKALDDVRTRTDQARADLPRDVDPPLVRRLEIDDQPIITYAVSAPALSIQELSWFIEDTIARTLQAAPGVAQVRRVGGVDREINVVVDPDRLAAQGLTADNVNQALAVASLDAPGGRVTVGGREQTLRILGAAVTVEQIRDITIPTGGGRSVRLSDVADVGDGSAEVRSFALLNGQPVVGFQVSKVKDASEITTENGVAAAIEKLLKTHEGVSITKILSRVDQTRAGFIATWHTLLEGMLLAALVVFIFLRDWRSTLITADRDAGLADPDVLLHEHARVQPEHGDAAGADARDRHPGRRRHRRDREHRKARLPRVASVRRRHSRRRPDCPCRRGDDLRDCRHVLSGRLHAGDSRPVLPRVRRHGDRRRAVLAAGGAPADAADGRVFPRAEAGQEASGAAGVLSARARRGHSIIVGASVVLATCCSSLSIALVVPLPKGVQPEGNPNFLSVAIEAPPGSTISRHARRRHARFTICWRRSRRPNRSSRKWATAAQAVVRAVSPPVPGLPKERSR